MFNRINTFSYFNSYFSDGNNNPLDAQPQKIPKMQNLVTRVNILAKAQGLYSNSEKNHFFAELFTAGDVGTL